MKRSHTTPSASQGKGSRLARIVAAVTSILVAVAIAFAWGGRAEALPRAGTATVLVYLNGSDLESEGGAATDDIAEMLASGIGTNANVVIETLGTRKWHNYGIASDHTQRYAIENGELKLVDDSLGQLDTTDPQTLSDFIGWGVENYPANRYILLLWDHGGGPVYGFGVDEFQEDEYASLTLDEMQQALGEHPDVHFDIIGMDCCIMASVETCKVLAPYCDYTVLSEDFEPEIGWSYQDWMSMLENDPAVDTVELGKAIVDGMVTDVAADEENGDATLALIDESAVSELYDAWVAFAYAHEDALSDTSYGQEVTWQGRPVGYGHGPVMDFGHGPSAWEDQGDWGSWKSEDDWSHCDEWGAPSDWYGDEYWNSWDDDMSYVTMTDYYVTDLGEVASSAEGEEAAALKAALDQAIVHYGCTEGDESMCGLSVTLPYGDPEYYEELVDVFTACGFDEEYVTWLEGFVDVASDDYGYEMPYAA